MRHRTLMIVIFALWVVCSSASAEANRGPTLGYCDKEYIYSADDKASKEGSLSVIFRQPLRRSSDELKMQSTYSYAMATNNDRTYRWRIAKNVYYGSSVDIEHASQHTKRIPLADLDLFDDANPIAYDFRVGQRAKRYPYDYSLSDCHNWFVDPLYHEYQKILKIRPPVWREEKLSDTRTLYWEEAPKVPEVSSDILPIGDTDARLFVHTKKRIAVWSGSYNYGEDGLSNEFQKHFSWMRKWGAKPDEEFPVPFDESFFVIAQGDNYYFVTRSGALYLAPKPEKGKPRATVELWKHADQPIARVITDTTTNKVFAFTSPKKNKDGMVAKPAYFEIVAKPEPVEFDPKSITPSKAVEPMKSVREAVDALLAAKKIALVESKDKR